MTVPKRAVAWDPRNPATLLLPSVSDQKEFQINSFLSHDGVGCNEQERTALMDLLDAQDTYLESNVFSPQGLLSLSKAYRRALAECVQRWDDELSNHDNDHTGDQEDSKMMTDTQTSDSLPAGQENLELLKIAYAVTHLSETFLLLPASDHAMDYYETTSNLPGAVTAETVRYLRLHHLAEAADFIDAETLEQLFSSYQPEQVDESGALYWKLMERYIVRGNLEDAWALITRHSLCRQCTEADYSNLDDYTAATLDEDREGLEALRAILLSAPLPGGRSDEFDGSFVVEDSEDDPNSYIEGIPPSAYRLWETNSSRRGSGDVPTTYNPHVAKQVYQSWKQSIRGLAALNKLKRRIPQLAKMLNILGGDFAQLEFDSWAEEFCAELLYKIPDLRLIDMHVRASRVMKKSNSEETSGGTDFEEVVLSVMKGNAGRVIEVMHQLGGGSGAALPAVMTSLLCNLLDHAQIMPQASDNYSLKTELLLNAAFAIHSSFGMEGHQDVGTRLTVRFLLPCIKIDSDVRITATLVNTLEHHAPKTDAEANVLLALCRKLVERKNIRVLDGCVSICLARYRYYLQDQRPGGAVHWLMVGMEFESLVLGSNSSSSNSNNNNKKGTAKEPTGANWQQALESGVCHRLLVTHCLETSRGLLKGLLGEEEGVSLLYGRAKEMITTALEESDFSSFLRPAKALEHILVIAEAIAEKKDESIVASSIVACLEEQPNEDDDGVVSSLARSPMHWDLLRLAKGILERSAQRDGLQEKQDYNAFFDVRGMQVLLERFTVIAAAREMEGQPLPSNDVREMRLALGEGLMRAFVAENGIKKAHNGASKMSVSGIYASDLGKYSREKQELVVSKMLDF